MAGMSPVRQDVTVVGRRLEPEDHRLRDFLTRVDQAFAWVEAGTPEADALLAAHGLAEADLPLVVAPDGVVSAATVERVADAWHESDPPQRSHYDLAIVGAGPAGLAAAVYAASDGLSTLLVERDVPGGQASHTSKIENFFGFPGGI
jgi:thioredoxin reductase (NADPH)